MCCSLRPLTRILRAQKLPVGGLKAELQQRLSEAILLEQAAGPQGATVGQQSGGEEEQQDTGEPAAPTASVPSDSDSETPAETGSAAGEAAEAAARPAQPSRQSAPRSTTARA